MSLEEDLKARTLALISQQMANWVVDIQKAIADHQGNLVRALDELQETVARYDEKIDENEIASAMAEVVASQPPSPAAGPGFDRLKRSIAAVEKGASLSEVLTYLVNEVSQYVDRAAMFIVKGPSAIGWYSKGVEPARHREAGERPAHRRHRVPHRAGVAPRRARADRGVAGHGAGAGPSRRQPRTG